jgi:hypothetical protein
MSTNLEVASTILEQMGGSGKLTCMIGAHDFTGSPDALTFRFRARGRDGSNCCRVSLLPSDTYKVEFISIRGNSVKSKGVFEDIYAEDLRGVFERQTGLYLSLGTMKYVPTGT